MIKIENELRRIKIVRLHSTISRLALRILRGKEGVTKIRKVAPLFLADGVLCEPVQPTLNGEIVR